jgi:hypothetical protein
VCSNCYKPIREEVSIPDDLGGTRHLNRPDTTEKHSLGTFCECGSDGVAHVTPRTKDEGRLSLRELVDMTRHAVWSMNALGHACDYIEAVSKAEELKSENELGDDTIILEAVEEALER